MSTSAHLPPKSLVFLQCWLQQKRSSSKATIHYQYIRMLPPTEEKFEGVFLLMLWLENLQLVIFPSVVWPPGLPTFCNQSRCHAHRLPVCFSARRRWILNSIHPRLPPHLLPDSDSNHVFTNLSDWRAAFGGRSPGLGCSQFPCLLHWCQVDICNTIVQVLSSCSIGGAL